MIGSELKQSVCLKRQQESKLVSGQFPLHCFLVKNFAFSKKCFSVKKIGDVEALSQSFISIQDIMQFYPNTVKNHL